MIQSPIKRKHTHYPKDFLPPCNPKTQSKRFAFNEDYQIETSRIQKYQRSIDDHHTEPQKISQSLSRSLNPQKTVASCRQLEQESPLAHHLSNKMHDLDDELLKKPRFSMFDKEEIAESGQQMFQNSMSPGCIKKQLQSRQNPLPQEDPCKIEHYKSGARNKVFMNSCIKYRSSGDFHNKNWISSQKDLIKQFNQSRNKKEAEQLPKLSRIQMNQSVANFAIAKQKYEAFRKRQQFIAMEKKSYLKTAKHLQDDIPAKDVPKYDPETVDKLKRQINSMVKLKKGKHNQQESQSSQTESNGEHRGQRREASKSYNNTPSVKVPQLLISYRSSLSYLKDLHSKAEQLTAYRLIVKIPKIFVERLIFREQQRQQLYDTAKLIFRQLKIPHQNLVIKKYTNCIMMIVRNICLIWHFDGRRFLGGWQSEYLDEGFKHGLGLEWQPKKYVYYGEFIRNKKHGLGIYKDRNENNYIGYWHKNQRIDNYEGYEASPQIEEGGFYQNHEQEFEESGHYGFQYL